jgi:cellulose synthase (UDP-forming)
MKQGADRDFLVLGTNTDQPGIGKLSNSLPVALNGDSVHVQDEEGFFAPLHHAWWKIKKTDQDTSGEFTVTGTPDSMIEGLESPYAAKRSIVVVSVRNEATFEPLMANFLKAAQSSDISGSVSVLHGSDFQSFRLGNNVYHVGSLPWWTRASLWFMQVPWMVAFAVLFVCFVFAVFARSWLRRRARIRLEIVEN